MNVDLTRSSEGNGDGSAAEPFLRLESISKSYGDVKVVSDLNLGVEKGEFISLLGPSGCGKTTTLRMIAGFISPDQGRIIVDGVRVDEVPSHKRGMTMVFQNYALFPHMTVGENVAFGLRMHKVAKSEIVTRVGEALELVRLSALANRYPRELSGGQQQRVALARAIVLNPKLLLLDEPLSNLDAKLRKELRSDFLEIHRVAGITTILVTHDLEEAFSVSDRVAVMNHGRTEQFATPIEIFARPATPFVAEFVGHSNVVDGIADDAGAIRCQGFLLASNIAHAPGTAVRVAIPAHVIRVATENLQLENSFAATVRSVSFLGALLQLDIEFGSMLLRAEIPVSASAMRIRAGDAVHIGWNAEDLIQLPVGKV